MKNTIALDALNQITSATTRRYGGSSDRLAAKLKVLKENGFLRSGKLQRLSMRAALVQVALAVKAGASSEQIRETGVHLRGEWKAVHEHVAVYALSSLSPNQARRLLRGLELAETTPEEVEVEEVEVEVKVEVPSEESEDVTSKPRRGRKPRR